MESGLFPTRLHLVSPEPFHLLRLAVLSNESMSRTLRPINSHGLPSNRRTWDYCHTANKGGSAVLGEDVLNWAVFPHKSQYRQWKQQEREQAGTKVEPWRLVSVAMAAVAPVAVFRSGNRYNWLKMTEMKLRDRKQNSFAAEGNNRPPVSFHHPPKV